jgi:hypothetical protein
MAWFRVMPKAMLSHVYSRIGLKQRVRPKNSQCPFILLYFLGNVVSQASTIDSKFSP